MSQQRQNPLPVARYWVTAFGNKQDVLDTFLHLQSQLGNVQTVTTEGIDATSDHPAGSFYIFIVKKPDAVPWDGAQFGFPNLAGADIKSLSDTVNRPDKPLDGLDQLGNLLGTPGGEGLLGGIGSGLKLAGYGIAGYLLLKLFGGPKR